jgi:hypothetical protein
VHLAIFSFSFEMKHSLFLAKVRNLTHLSNFYFSFETKPWPFRAKVRYHAFAAERCNAFDAYTDIDMFVWGNHNVNRV